MSKLLKGFTIIGEFDDVIHVGNTIIGANKDKCPQILDKTLDKFVDIKLDKGDISFTKKHLVKYNNKTGKFNFSEISDSDSYQDE